MAGNGAGFDAIESFFPAGAEVAVEDLPETRSLSTAEREVFDRLGVDTVVDAVDCSPTELAAEAATKALAAAGLDPGDLDVVISLEPRAPDFLLASAATQLQHRIGASSALALGISDLGCVSVSVAIQAAIGLLGPASPYETVLVATGSRPGTPRRFRHPVCILGDGGVAGLISRSGAAKVTAIATETNGAYSDLFRIDYRSAPPDEWREELSDMRRYSMELAIESRNRFAVLNDAVLARARRTRDDVDRWAMQNISLGAFAFYANAFDIDFAEPCFEHLARFGHLGAGDVLLNLRASLGGGPVLVMNNSPVAAWSSMLVEG
jgi:3-oxoacyl-[acyl-carrier-protein] synthase III